jgi:cytoskeletal protein RodZ
MFKWLTDFLESPKLDTPDPKLKDDRMGYELGNYGMSDGSSNIKDAEERKHRHNSEELAKADLALQKAALQKNLTLMHRTMIVALVGVVVAIVIGLLGVLNRPDITVRPNITVRMYEPKTTTQTPTKKSSGTTSKPAATSS